MGEKIAQFVIKGMQRDLSASKFNPDFAYENMNIRITAREGKNLLSVTNEKGNVEITILDNEGEPLLLEGNFVGRNVLNNIITILTCDVYDKIYRLIYTPSTNSFVGTILYDGTVKGNLGFNVLNPIETLGVYENEDIQKVYWVDGINQPRFINVAPSVDITKFNSSSFDFA